MRKLFILLLIFFAYISYAEAGTLSVSISSPSSGATYTTGDTFTLTSTAFCGGTGSNCNSVSMTASFSSGLSTSSTNPQSCGNIAKGSSCTQSWTVSANSAGSQTNTVTATSSNTPTDSNSVSVTVVSGCGNGVCSGSETTSSCPQDCCDADCTATTDTTCYSACNTYNGCALTSGCNSQSSGSAICTSSTAYATCCEGVSTSCGAGETCSGGVCSTPPAVCGDATCAASETTSSCPQDCCDADCTSNSDTTCHSACNTYNGCSISSGCDSQTLGANICSGSTAHLTCCEGSTTNCGSGQTCSSGNCITTLNCGNGVIDTGEQCDGSALGGETCVSRGFTSGTLSCTGLCAFDTTGCTVTATTTTPAVCGDGSCTGAEECSTCAIDCGACVTEQLYIVQQFPINQDTLKRGEYNFKIKLYLGSNLESSANVKATSPFWDGDLILFDDSIHGDERRDDGILGNKFTIGNNIEKGTYTIRIVADRSDAHSEIILKVNVDPELRINLPLELGYTQGDRINLIGNVRDFKGTTTSNVKIYAVRKGETLFNKVIEAQDGNIKDSYLISYADPDGKWEITAEASDDYFNYGKLKQKINIGTYAGVLYYGVNFLTPIKGSSFTRDDSVPIAVEVKEEGKIIEGAKVQFISPKGKELTLEEIDPGIYSTTYKIEPDDLLGPWRLAVQAIKSVGGLTRAGGNNLILQIKPGEIKLNVISPSRDTAYVGGRIKYLIKPEYLNGEIVKGADISVLFSNNKSIQLIENEPGVYSGDYLVGFDDIGTLEQRVNALDRISNEGTILSLVYVRKRTFVETWLALFYEYVLRRYWWAITALIIFFSILYKPTFDVKYLTIKLTKNKKEQELIKNMQVEAERKYYKERSISRAEFKQLIQEYEGRLAKVLEKKKKLEAGLKEKLNKHNKANKR